jgi:hypothetical protein
VALRCTSRQTVVSNDPLPSLRQTKAINPTTMPTMAPLLRPVVSWLSLVTITLVCHPRPSITLVFILLSSSPVQEGRISRQEGEVLRSSERPRLPKVFEERHVVEATSRLPLGVVEDVDNSLSEIVAMLRRPFQISPFHV